MAPDIDIILATRTPPTNPESKYGLPFIFAPCSQGPYDTIREIRNNTDLLTLGYGELPTLVAAVLRRAGGPVYALRTRPTTPGAVWTEGLVKEPSVRTYSLYVYGRIKLAGADANGDLTWMAKALGVSLQVVTDVALGHSISGSAISLVIPAATAADDVVTYWNAQADLVALASIKAEGTGASNAGTTLAATSFDHGALKYTGLEAGYQIRQREQGNATALAHAFGGTGNKECIVSLATDADGTATSTANAVIAELDDIANKFTVEAVGDGTGLAGTQASLVAIPFGSAGAATLSGTPFDRTNLIIEILTAGTVGGTPAPTFRWAVDDARREDGTTFGRGNGALALVPRRRTPGAPSDGKLRVKITQQLDPSLALSHSWDGVTFEVLLGTDAGSLGITTAEDVRDYIVSIPRLRAALLAYLPSGDGSAVMEESDEARLDVPSVKWSAPTAIPAGGIVQLKNAQIDTGLTVTFTAAALDVGDVFSAQAKGPVSSVTDMDSAAAVALADATRRVGFLVWGSPIDRTAAATVAARTKGALNGRQVWSAVQSRPWDPEIETETEWEADLIADWLGFVSLYLAKFDGECTHVSAYTARAQTRGGIFEGCAAAALAPYHQDLGKVRAGPTSGSLPSVTGIWHNSEVDTSLHDQRGVTIRTDEDAPGSFFFRSSPTLSDPTDVGRNLLQFVRTDLVCAREAKLTLRQFRNEALDYSTTPDPSDPTVVAGALTVEEADRVRGAIEANIKRELERKKKDGQSSVSPLNAGASYSTVLRTNDYFTDRTIHVEVAAPKRPPAQRGVITVYDQPEGA
jgi:hypothetical protein